MYYIDTLVHTVDAFDYDCAEGEMSNRRVVFDIRKAGIEGYLDGMTIDRAGHLWIAIFNAARVIGVVEVFHETLRHLLNVLGHRGGSHDWNCPQVDLHPGGQEDHQRQLWRTE